MAISDGTTARTAPAQPLKTDVNLEPNLKPEQARPEKSMRSGQDRTRPGKQRGELIIETPHVADDAGGHKREAIDLSQRDRLVLRGRFVPKPQPGSSDGLVLKDDRNRLVHLSREHTKALLKNDRANAIVAESMQNTAHGPNVNLTYFKGKWSVSQPDRVFKPR